MRIRPGPGGVRQWGLSTQVRRLWLKDSTILQVLREADCEAWSGCGHHPQDKVTRLEEGREDGHGTEQAIDLKG